MTALVDQVDEKARRTGPLHNKTRQNRHDPQSHCDHNVAGPLRVFHPNDRSVGCLPKRDRTNVERGKLTGVCLELGLIIYSLGNTRFLRTGDTLPRAGSGGQ